MNGKCRPLSALIFPFKNIFIVFILVLKLFKTNGKCRLLLCERNFEFSENRDFAITVLKISILVKRW